MDCSSMPGINVYHGSGSHFLSTPEKIKKLAFKILDTQNTEDQQRDLEQCVRELSDSEYQSLARTIERLLLNVVCSSQHTMEQKKNI